MKPTTTRRTTFALAGLLTLALGSTGRPQTGSPPLPRLPGEPVRLPTEDPPAPTVERLIEQLEQVHAKKLELEQQEKALKTQLTAALVKQRERLSKVGLAPTPPRPSAEIPSLPDPPPPLRPGS